MYVCISYIRIYMFVLAAKVVSTLSFNQSQSTLTFEDKTCQHVPRRQPRKELAKVEKLEHPRPLTPSPRKKQNLHKHPCSKCLESTVNLSLPVSIPTTPMFQMLGVYGM